jgi:hypothetical protein
LGALIFIVVAAVSRRLVIKMRPYLVFSPIPYLLAQSFSIILIPHTEIKKSSYKKSMNFKKVPDFLFVYFLAFLPYYLLKVHDL